MPSGVASRARRVAAGRRPRGAARQAASASGSSAEGGVTASAGGVRRRLSRRAAATIAACRAPPSAWSPPSPATAASASRRAAVRLPDDLRRFKQITLGTPIVMGRKTWQSIGRPLPGRRNIVVTRDAGCRAEGADSRRRSKPPLALAASAPLVHVIGGAEHLRPRPADRRPAGADRDRCRVRRPTPSFRPGTGAASWRLRASSARPAEGLRYAFVTYKKRPEGD